MIRNHSFRKFEKFYPILLQVNYLILFCLIGVLIQPAGLLAESPWQLHQKDNELTVYTRKAEDAVGNEFKAVIIIHQPAEVVGTVLMDIPTYSKWIDGCMDVKLLNKNNDSNKEVYLVINAPWPFYNRDIIYRIKSGAVDGEGRMIVQGKAIEKANVLTRKGYVRVIDAYFHVALEKITDSSTKVIYQSKTDVSGNAPVYLSRMVCGDMVYNSIVNLKKLLNNLDINRKKEIAYFEGNESYRRTNK